MLLEQLGFISLLCQENYHPAEENTCIEKCCKVLHTMYYCLCLKHPVSFVICHPVCACMHTLCYKCWFVSIFRFACLGSFL